jgi:hypothetical protein
MDFEQDVHVYRRVLVSYASISVCCGFIVNQSSKKLEIEVEVDTLIIDKSGIVK